MPVRNALYVKDFYAWSNQQAALLRAGKLEQVDLEHVAEEIETMGKAEKRELVNRLTVLLLHLLKWRFQPALRGRSWRLSIEGQRLDIEEHLNDNPSLKNTLDASIRLAYRRALIEAERETGLDASTFPKICPYVFAAMMDGDFWPQ